MHKFNFVWKIYFYLYTILGIVGIVAIAPSLHLMNLISWVGLIESLILILGLYCYIYKKKNFLKHETWRIIFVLISFEWAVQLIYYFRIIPFLDPLLGYVENSPPQTALSY